MTEENQFICPGPECEKPPFKKWQHMRAHVAKKHPELLDAVDAANPKEKIAEPEAHPARVTVVFRGPGIGMLADRQVLANETREVPWNEWLRISTNKKYERIDV